IAPTCGEERTEKGTAGGGDLAAGGRAAAGRAEGSRPRGGTGASAGRVEGRQAGRGAAVPVDAGREGADGGDRGGETPGGPRRTAAVATRSTCEEGTPLPRRRPAGDHAQGPGRPRRRAERVSLGGAPGANAIAGARGPSC